MSGGGETSFRDGEVAKAKDAKNKLAPPQQMFPISLRFEPFAAFIRSLDFSLSHPLVRIGGLAATRLADQRKGQGSILDS